jgi:hypothetical protein
MQRQIKQVWHDVRDWEEVASNMWGEVLDQNQALQTAIAFTSDHKLYGSFMKKVCNEWLISCENALTDPYINQKAWLGHAAVALAYNIPEDITRKAWSYLTDEQKYLANKEAEREVSLWKERYIKSSRVHKSVGEKSLF